MTSTIYLMRHADRDGSSAYDDPINDAGRARARDIHWNCDLVIVSPLRRTMQTLEASGIRYRRKIVSDLCREWRDGISQNYLPGEPLTRETDEEFSVRARAFADLLRAEAREHASILVVTHGVFMVHFLKLNRLVGYCEYIQWTGA